MENIIKQLEQFKVDTIYGKKKHYNAADRKRSYYKLTSFSQIILNAISGSALLTVVFGNGNKTGEIVALVFTILATIIASVQKIGDFENQAQGNAKVADMYLNISKKINLILNCIRDEVLFEQDIVTKVEEICQEISQTNELASQFYTNKGDYLKAKQGIDKGEENYTDKELDLWN